MKKIKKSTVILYGLCAVVCIIRVIVGIIFKEYDDSVWLFILNAACAIVWAVGFIKWLLIYRSNVKDDDGA